MQLVAVVLQVLVMVTGGEVIVGKVWAVICKQWESAEQLELKPSSTSLVQCCKLKNTPGTRVGPGFCDQTLAVKNRKKHPEIPCDKSEYVSTSQTSLGINFQ